MNKIWYKQSGVEVFSAKGIGTIRFGIYYSKHAKDKNILKFLRLIHLGFGFYVMLPYWLFKKVNKYLDRTPAQKKFKKIYRSDLQKWEERKLFFWKYSLFGEPNQYSLFRK